MIRYGPDIPDLLGPDPLPFTIQEKDPLEYLDGVVMETVDNAMIVTLQDGSTVAFDLSLDLKKVSTLRVARQALENGAVLYIVIRAPGPAMGPPLGVRRVMAPSFPLEVTIDDNDTATFTINDVSVSESDDTATFTVTLSATSSEEVTFNFATANGTAVAGEDGRVFTDGPG